MGDDDKPFACTATGCGMRFANEDHLTVHRKKHEMSLNLSAAASVKSSALFMGTFCDSDQTPTPTRFIRSCEEVGLFQDLQTVNPFEEQFRKAVEAARSTVVVSTASAPHQSEPTHSNADSDVLNTPAVLVSDLVDSTTSNPVVATEKVAVITKQEPSSTTTDSEDEIIIHSSHSGISSATEVTSTASTVTATPQVISMVLPTQSTPTVPCTQTTPVIASATTVVQLLLKLPDGRSIPVQLPAVPVISAPPPTVTVSQPTMATTNVTSLAKMKLKQALTQNHQSSTNNNSMRVVTEAVTMVTAQRHRAEATLSPDGRPAQLISKRRRTSEEDPDEKRRRFLERNRAAATRCRIKRKQWITQLEKKADELATTNQQLQNRNAAVSCLQSEVAALRNEVAQLKTMLLAHKDCPVTLQQRGIGQTDGCTQNTMTMDEVAAVQISSAEAIASSALTHMAHGTTSGLSPFPVDIIIETDPADLNHVHENSNNEVDK